MPARFSCLPANPNSLLDRCFQRIPPKNQRSPSRKEPVPKRPEPLTNRSDHHALAGQPFHHPTACPSIPLNSLSPFIMNLPRHVRWILMALLGTGSFLTSGMAADQMSGKRPNVVLILADDLGFSDLGCYGGEIPTPQLDALASEGLRYTQFYNTARCWPSRASALSGFYAQQVRRDTVPGVQSGNNGKRPSWARLLPEYLRDLGYRSYHSGKWHVDGKPLVHGFDRS
jgi:hypothetical protein